MTSIAETLNGVTVGEPVTHLNLALYPILSDAANDPDYLVLDDALAGACARVTEVDEGGSVPELKFFNGCDRPVLLLDGEELVGAKQNRILNVSVLAPAGAEIVIPVSCVEAGRWHAESAEFSPSDRAHYASGRASKMRSVSESLRTTQSRRSNQAAVWDDIAAKSMRLEVHSDTEAAEAMYEAHRPKLEAFLAAFEAAVDQTGAIFAINGRLAGVELFDSPRTFGRLIHKLVQSYALDAIDEGGDKCPEVSADGVAKFVDEVADARVEHFPGVGIGEDLRLSSEAITGGALEADGRVVHLSAFRLKGQGSGRGRTAGMVRASRRSSHHDIPR